MEWISVRFATRTLSSGVSTTSVGTVKRRTLCVLGPVFSTRPNTTPEGRVTSTNVPSTTSSAQLSLSLPASSKARRGLDEGSSSESEASFRLSLCCSHGVTNRSPNMSVRLIPDTAVRCSTGIFTLSTSSPCTNWTTYASPRRAPQMPWRPLSLACSPSIPITKAQSPCPGSVVGTKKNPLASTSTCRSVSTCLSLCIPSSAGPM
mmetsp:Transcript_28777/g.61338  ORF Transcript_28777/g.61338 Transcript_28777/m.61338 type:complete len:205 (-) Transcript_28777:334-948(-)